VRRGSRTALPRYGRAIHHVDLAVRDTRILARHGARLIQGGAPPQPALAEAARELKRAVWELAGELDGGDRPSALRAHLARATGAAGTVPGVETAALVAQVRSVAADLLRASDATRPEISQEPPTEELLAGLAA
jgi:hypothetical protein